MPRLNVRGLRRIRWNFDSAEGPIWTGYTDDTTWNGWLNVWVTPTVHAKVIAEMRHQEKEQPGSAEDTIIELEGMAPDLRGLVSYAYGYTTSEIER